MKKIISILLLSTIINTKTFAYNKSSVQDWATIALISLYTAPVLKNFIEGISESITRSNNTPVACISIKGGIFDIDDIVKKLHFASENYSAILLKIDSPGGAAGSSSALAKEVEVARSKVPVVALVSTSCASGAYMVASACDKIITAPSSVVGSIGAYFHLSRHAEIPTNYSIGSGGIQAVKTETEFVKAGKFKTMGDPSKGLTAEERELFKTLITEEYEFFTKYVADNRGLDRKDLSKWADGQVFSGRMALDLNLIDQVGTLTDAKLSLKEIILQRTGSFKGKVLLYDLEDKGNFLQKIFSAETYADFLSEVYTKFKQKVEDKNQSQTKLL